MTAVPRELQEAYENADYAVFLEPELILKIGEPSERLDRLMLSVEVATAAIISACNPRSERRSDEENRAATEALRGLVEAAGYPHYRAEGRDPEGRAPSEPGLLILGIFRDNAEALGRLFGQNAIVFIEPGRAPALAFLK